MLRSDGTGNFTETTDGDGRTWYTGYNYANDLVNRMNERNNLNVQMNIPTGNSTPVLNKNHFYVLDAVYFRRDNSTFNFNSGNTYNVYGEDKNNVINIFLSYCPANDNSCSSNGYASTLDHASKIKYTENQSYWQNYVITRNSSAFFGYFIDATAANTLHELGHLTGLSHTIRYNSAPPCPSGCGNTIDYGCDDGCTDTPTAWDIMSANGCTKHPACGWNKGTEIDCSNNVMDYNGDYALTPCQLGIIHTGLVGGMRSYLVCDAVNNNLTLNDIGYPKLTYFGKDVVIGNSTSLANVTNEEKIKLYFSSTVELNNFEIRADSEFEVLKESTCTF